MSISPEFIAHLPVQSILPELTRVLQQGHGVLTSPTGSGKTTLVPLILHQTEWLAGKKILMLEPRRIAARAAAIRMSEMLGEQVGTTIGYRTRFDSKVSSSTSIEVVTEGILIRRLQNDPELTGIGLVIFDEFHERSMQADLGLALCLDLCDLREDLRLLVMSATLETAGISQLLGNTPVLQAQGKNYPVTIHYLPPTDAMRPLWQQVLRAVHLAWQQEDGDILVFLPGAGEIRRCLPLLQEQLPKALVLPLYGNLSHTEQDRVFLKNHTARRIILATPIAETSITIEKVSCVVDSGYFRRPIYNSTSGLSRLSTMRISQASADQRTGRAGRMGPGSCYRLWSKETAMSLLPHTPPGILHADLCSLVLELALWGVVTPTQLSWLDPPRSSAWNGAVNLLRQLTLLDSCGRITPLGKKVAALPIHPRLGYMLLQGQQLGLGYTACLLAATLTERDLCRGADCSVDILERVRILDDFQKTGNTLPTYTSRQLCRRLLQQVKQWLHLLDNTLPETIAYEELGNLLAYAFPDRIALIRPGSRYRYQLANGRGAELPPADILAGNRMLVVPQIDARNGDGKVFLATPVNESDLLKQHPHLFHEEENISWDEKNGRVQTSIDVRINKITVQRKPLSSVNASKVSEVFLRAIQHIGSHALPWTKEARELQARICSLHYWQNMLWPDLGDEVLMQDLDWLAPYCQQLSRLNQLKGLSLKTILLSRLTWKQQLQLEQLAPTHLQVPSGSRIRLGYEPTQAPVLAVRLQELFGLTDTPCVCGGEIPILLHLLSPAGRPMQVTSDLQSFWQNTYPEIKKELAGRYPKHHWPDDPLKAIATSRTKKTMRSHSG